MNDLLEKKIKIHADELFDSKPQSGHRERFVKKLAQQKKLSKRIPMRTIFGYVAVAALLAGVVFFTQSPDPITENDDSLADVQNYYAMQLDHKVSEIQELLESVNPENKADILSDIEMMQSETDLILQTTEEENIPFVVGLYSSKMEALDHIQSILE